MVSNLDRYREDLDALIASGDALDLAMQAEFFSAHVRRELKEKNKDIFKGLPSFRQDYQRWYTEAKTLIRQLLPDRLSDFVAHYEKPRPRKDITYESYRIEDYLQGLVVTHGFEKQKVVGPDAAVPHFQQQLAILSAVRARFESSLFDIRQLAQADLFDSELDAAEELAGKKFARAAGALAGVVLERHLAQVCENHAIKIGKKEPAISDLNDALKNSNTIEIPQWRFLQHLADIRNLCDHNKKADPTEEQVDDLVAGVRKITKTLF